MYIEAPGDPSKDCIHEEDIPIIHLMVMTAQRVSTGFLDRKANTARPQMKNNDGMTYLNVFLSS